MFCSLAPIWFTETLFHDLKYESDTGGAVSHPRRVPEAIQIKGIKLEETMNHGP